MCKCESFVYPIKGGEKFMKKGIITVLILLIVIISITTVNAAETNSSNMEISDSHMNTDEISPDLSANPGETSNIISDEYDDKEDYIVAFFNNTTITQIKNEEINFNVKNITEYDSYYNETFTMQLSTFKINGQEYTMVKSFPTAGVYGYPIFEKFNPDEYDIYDGIMYKMVIH